MIKLRPIQIPFIVSLGIAGLLLVGCTGLRNEVGPSPLPVEESVVLPPEFEDVPIVDIHTHTFNARYLPLRNIALGKRDAHFFLQFVPDPVAEAIAYLISSRTPLFDMDRGQPEALGMKQISEEQLLQAAADECDVSYDRLANDPAVKALQRLIPVLEGESSELKTLSQGEAKEQRKQDAKLTKSLQNMGFEVQESSLRTFLRALMARDDRQRSIYTELYGKQVELTVSHYLDLGPTYNQRPDLDADSLFLDFETQQLKRASYFQRQPKSGTIFFAGFNPYRDHWPSDRGTKALDLIKRAVFDPTIGAYGVKFYPPSGYRPTGNDIPRRPCTLFTRHPRSQWDARYKGITDAELDRRMEEFLRWCEVNDVPVFAHCNTGEFEARKNYGVEMSDPVWWKAYLEKCSHENHGGDPCNLRLALGHAGGSDFWFDRGKHQDWGNTVVELCETYPNVYCEIGIFGEIAESGGRDAFVAVVSKLFKRSCGDYPFSEKVMYGTDFFMPSGASAKAYLGGFQKAFLDPGLRHHYVDFFLGNALRYLNAAERMDGQGDLPPLPESSRLVLERLLQVVDEP